MANENDFGIQAGSFLLENEIITKKQLSEALELQKDNPQRLLGEILVTLGAVSKEELIMALQMYYIATEQNPKHVDEWLDQEEIDMLLDRMKEEKAQT